MSRPYNAEAVAEIEARAVAGNTVTQTDDGPITAADDARLLIRWLREKASEADHYRAAYEQAEHPAITCQEEREAGNGGCGMCVICCDEAARERDEARAEVIKELANRMIQKAKIERERDEAQAVYQELCDECAELLDILRESKITAERIATLSDKLRSAFVL